MTTTAQKQMGDLDSVLRQLGDFGGRYQTMQFCLLCLYGAWFTAWLMMSIVFTASSPLDYHCTPTPGFTANDTVPCDDTDGNGVGQCDKCQMFAVHDGIVTGNVTGCEYGWDYKMTQEAETTIVTDFNLVCERDILGETVQSVFFGGVLAGAAIFGQLSDIVGRKIVIHVSLVGAAASGLTLSLVWNYYLVVILIFFVGMFQQGIHLTTFVMYMEMFTPEKRSLVGGIGNLMWGVGVALIAPLAFLLPNWRHLQMTVSLVCLMGLPFYWFFHESVRWLISRGRIEEAEIILQKIAKFNNIAVPKNLLTSSLSSEKVNEASIWQSEKQEDNAETYLADESPACDPMLLGETGSPDEKYDSELSQSKTAQERELRDAEETGANRITTSQETILHLLRRPILLRNYILMCYCWFVSSIVYYGLSLTSVNLAGNKYLNMFLVCVVEIPSSVFIIIVLKWFPRRWCLCISFLIAGVFCFMTATIPIETDNGTDLTPLIVTAATLGKFAITFSFCLVFIYTSEWLPTIVRNVGIGGTALCARIGGMVAPFLVYLGGVNNNLLPLLIFGVLTIFAAILALFFPETLNLTMPTTINDAEKLARRQSTLCTRKRRLHTNVTNNVE